MKASVEELEDAEFVGAEVHDFPFAWYGFWMIFEEAYAPRHQSNAQEKRSGKTELE
jgi:hypothetical protein